MLIHIFYKIVASNVWNKERTTNELEKGIALALAAVSMAAVMAGCGNTASDNQKKIGIIQLVEHPSLDAANKGFIDGLASKGYKDGENIKIDYQNAQADQSI